MGVGGWVEIIRIKAVLSSTGLELELELSLAKKTAVKKYFLLPPIIILNQD